MVGGAAATARATELGHGSELKHRTVKNDTDMEKAPEHDKRDGQ